MSDNKQINFQLAKVKEVSFSYDELLVENFDTDKIGNNLGIGINYAVEVDEKEEFLKLKVRVIYRFKGEKKTILNYTNQIYYKIKDLTNHIIIKDDMIDIDDEFLAILLNISIGTIRGMIAVKTMGKIINNFPLPILNPKKIIEETDFEKK